MATVAFPARRPAEGQDERAFDDGFDGDGQGSALNFEQVRAALVRNRWIILGTIAVCVAIAVVITVLMRPMYTATASVQIEQQAAKVIGSEDSEPAGGYQDAERFLQTQVDILRSRSLAERVVRALRLDRDTSFLTQMAVKLGDRPADRRTLRESATDLLMANFSVELPGTSRVAVLTFESPSAELSARVVNSYAEQFIIANLDRRFDATTYARNFLQGRLEDTRRRLERSERQVNAYARSSGLIDASNAASAGGSAAGSNAIGPRSLVVARLVELNGALVRAQVERTDAEQKWLQANKTPVMSLPEVLGNAAIQQLQSQRAVVVASYQEEKQRRHETYPTMIQKAAQIAELDKQIARMAQEVKRSISDAYRAAVAQERETLADVRFAEQEARSERDQEVGFNILRREVDTNRELYDGLLQRYKELSAAAGVTTNNISIVDRAEPPRRPTSPRLLLNLALGLIFGMAASAGIVLLRETFDDRVRRPEDVPAKLDLPLLGSIPKITSGVSPIAELMAPKSELSEAYQALRATLELSTSRGLPKSILLTSSRPSEGKSTSSFAVARTLARHGRKVILIDGDLRRPSLHKVLELENKAGTSNLLTGTVAVDDVLRDFADVPNLQVITSGPIPPDPAQLLDADTVHTVFDQLTSRCDVLVVDAPPVLGLADTLELAAAVEGVLFVVEAGSMHFGGVRSSIKRLRDIHVNLLGVVLNKFDAKAVGYSSSYSYSYQYKYGGN